MDAILFYHFLKSENHLLKLKYSKAFSSFNDAIKCFEINKDILGLVMCYMRLADLILNNSLENYGDTEKEILN
ncbi:MAG: hypothetical protein ACI9K1_001887 [Arcticibacterium sp.]